jgi:hypothetical protein
MVERTVIEFVLPFALESLNVRDRKHWSKRSKDKRDMSQEIMVAIGGPRHFPRPPWREVRITVVRCSAGRLDQDNANASVKSLFDCLCVKSSRHPGGLGIIEDDSADLLRYEVKQAAAAPGAGSTVVRIERIA